MPQHWGRPRMRRGSHLCLWELSAGGVAGGTAPLFWRRSAEPTPAGAFLSRGVPRARRFGATGTLRCGWAQVRRLRLRAAAARQRRWSGASGGGGGNWRRGTGWRRWMRSRRRCSGRRRLGGGAAGGAGCGGAAAGGAGCGGAAAGGAGAEALRLEGRGAPALPSVLPSALAFRRGQALLWLVPQPAARFAHAMDACELHRRKSCRGKQHETKFCHDGLGPRKIIGKKIGDQRISVRPDCGGLQRRSCFYF